jgi:hypothetical protein
MEKSTDEVGIGQGSALALLNYFIGRRDDYAEQTPDGYNRVGRPLTDEALEAHLEGKVTIGTYTLIPKQGGPLAGYGAVDLDFADGAIDCARVKQAWDAAVDLLGANHLVPEFSGKKGVHLWLVLAQPIIAWKVQQVLTAAVERAGLKGVEVFPKQTTLREDGYGNLMKLPLALHRGSGKRSYFLDPAGLEHGELVEAPPEDVDPVPLEEADLDRVLASLGIDSPKEPERKPPLRLSEKIKEGKRNDTLFRRAARWRDDGHTEEEILAMLRILNRSRCEDGWLEEKELEQIAWSVTRYDPKNDLAEGDDFWAKMVEAKKSDPDAGSTVSSPEREKAIEFFRRHLLPLTPPPLPALTEILQRGGGQDDPFEFLFSDGARVVIDDICSPLLVQKALAHATPWSIKSFSRPKWNAEVVRLIRTAARVVQVITEEEETMGWIRAHLKPLMARPKWDHKHGVLLFSDPPSEEYPSSLLQCLLQLNDRDGNVLVDPQGRIHLKLTYLLRTVTMDVGNRTSSRDLAKRLSRVGWDKIQLSAWDPETKKSPKWRCWVSPAGAWEAILEE